MIQVTPHMKVLVCTTPVDFRLGIKGFRAFCLNELSIDPFAGAILLFICKNKKSIKIFFYDEQGFWLCTKKMSKGVFKFWPKSEEKLSSIHASFFSSIIYNLDPNGKVKRWRAF